MTTIEPHTAIEPILDHYGLPVQELLALLHQGFVPRYAFATGSFVERRAGPTSDLDVRVVCCPSSEHPANDRSFRREDLVWCGSTVMTAIAGRAVHVVFWPEDAIDSIRRKITETVLDSESHLPVFTAEQIEFLEEIQVAVPVIGVDGFAAFRDSLDLDRFRSIYAEHLMAAYDQACGETQGPLLTDNVELAAVRSRRAVEAAVDCYLFANGRRVRKEKWRLRELLSVHDRDDQLVVDFLEHTLGGFADRSSDESLRRQVEDRLSWCNDLLLTLQA
ncbi:hypothetical protein [Streptomyces sp. MI02-7b]|uniref:hypothetical protein n=1 Tax=Streptomyces sp. MI02-7b TaxID=462941 RepID=UPI0029A7023F|nr:hypothetical protein [Streptomyces sp. MI02-7b]MDX3078382.1 hypothetical protein [Streptomyces sp. MI02-7b]